MPSPALIFAFLVATLYGSIYHLVVGGDARRLALLLLASWLGFTVGQVLGELLDMNTMNVGVIHFLSASLGAFIALLVVWLLTRSSNELEKDEL